MSELLQKKRLNKLYRLVAFISPKKAGIRMPRCPYPAGGYGRLCLVPGHLRTRDNGGQLCIFNKCNKNIKEETLKLEKLLTVNWVHCSQLWIEKCFEKFAFYSNLTNESCCRRPCDLFTVLIWSKLFLEGGQLLALCGPMRNVAEIHVLIVVIGPDCS